MLRCYLNAHETQNDRLKRCDVWCFRLERGDFTRILLPLVLFLQVDVEIPHAFDADAGDGDFTSRTHAIGLVRGVNGRAHATRVVTSLARGALR